MALGSYQQALLVLWTITLSQMDHSATGQTTCLVSDEFPEAKNMPATTRFTDIGPAVFAPTDVQCNVRTSPNCLFPQWDKKLKRWDEGCFCMEETLTGGGCIGDYNNDGFDDILFWNFNDRRNFSSVPEEGFILLSNSTNEISNWNKISLPPGPFGINQTKYNHAAKGDLNNDGYLDVVVGVTRADPYYEGAYIQVLINNGSGELIDETASRFNNQVRATSHHGEGNIYLRDMNLDGILDIVHSTRDFQSNYHGAHIAINDGSGNFQSLPNSVLPNRPDRGFNYTNSLYKGLPIDADKQGCLDLISSVDSWQDSTTSRNYLFSILNIDCGY